MAAHWQQHGTRVRRLRVSHAFHSARMEPVLAELEAAAGELGTGTPVLPLVSTLTGALAGPHEITASYWAAQARQPVRFADAVRAMSGLGITHFIEIGPDASLSALGPAILDDDAAFVPLQRRGQPSSATLLAGLAQAWTQGVTVDWAGMLARAGGRRTEIPTYAFQRQRFWPAGLAMRRRASAAGRGG
jgi:acyl transferase domain-containing protein